jgi:hypothetical protein
MMKHQVFVSVGDGLGVGEELVFPPLGEVAVDAGVDDVVDAGVVAEALGVADFDADADALADALLLAEATGTWMMEVAPTE